MIRRPPRSTRTDTLFPYTTRFRSADAIGRLHALFSDEAVLKVGHNLKYDIGVLAQHGITIAPYDDTLVMSFALGAGKHQHGLDELAKLHLDHVCISFKEVCGTGKSQNSVAEVPPARARSEESRGGKE